MRVKLDNKADDFAEQEQQVRAVLKHDDSAVIHCLEILPMQSLGLLLDSFEFDCVDALLRDGMLQKVRALHRESPVNELVKYFEFLMMQEAMHLKHLTFDLSNKKNRQTLKVAMSRKTQKVFDKMKMKNLASPKRYNLRIFEDYFKKFKKFHYLLGVDGF